MYIIHIQHFWVDCTKTCRDQTSLPVKGKVQYVEKAKPVLLNTQQ